MKYTTKATNIELTEKIEAYLKKKIAALDKYAGHFGDAASAHVELERTTRHHRTGEIFRAEIYIHIPHKELRVEASGSSIFGALDIAKDEISNELERAKEKDVDLKKRGARKLKRLLRES